MVGRLCNHDDDNDDAFLLSKSDFEYVKCNHSLILYRAFTKPYVTFQHRVIVSSRTCLEYIKVRSLEVPVGGGGEALRSVSVLRS